MRIAIRVVAAAAVFSSATFAAQAQQAVQWKVSDGGNGHWYRMDLALRSWTDARDTALLSGGHLATITSTAEMSFLRQNVYQLGQFSDTWLGLSRATCTEPFRWVTNESFNGSPPGTTLLQDCTGWAGPGTGNYIEHVIRNGTVFNWETESNDANVGNISVIEWSADCNNDGIVDYGQCRDGSLPDYNGNNIPDCCETGTPCEVGSYPVQWRVEDGGNGHWYQLGINSGNIRLDWTVAQSRAVGLGGHLATITGVAESAFVFSVAADPRGWWILNEGPTYASGPWLGGYQDRTASDYGEPNGGWRWITGEPWSWTHWWPGEPNNGCVYGEDYLNLVSQGFTTPSDWWCDAGDSCLKPHSFVIEWSADCNNDGIVDYGQILAGQFQDSNRDGVPDTCQCLGDVSGNGTVDGVDLAAILGAWGTNGNGEFQADINNDGIVGGTDLAYVLGGWGPCQ